MFSRPFRIDPRNSAVIVPAALGFMALGAAVAWFARPAVERLRAAHAPEPPVEDAMLVERVRAALSRVVYGSELIDVRAHSGHVVLRGPASPQQIAEMVACTQRVNGVRKVEDRLSVSGT
ncbi:MAG TPA: BON domain-containing protein [Usitatibacter sp.]|jgi:hypothetical protein|nr:BON domain-containing protein [Usitatibacter sp.]